MPVDQYLFILPVIFYEFLAIAVTRAIIPELFVEAFGDYVYHVIGITETIKGVLAFVSCPLIGKVSDKLGRKPCLLATVVGTTAPVCVLAFTLDMRVYAAAQALSGVFAGTFTLTFAYISDVVEPKGRAPAYGLALACLGLSFTVGPVSGGYLAAAFGPRAVFVGSLALVVADVAYIALVLPESRRPQVAVSAAAQSLRRRATSPRRTFLETASGSSSAATDDPAAVPLVPASYSPLDALEVFAGDPLLSQVAKVTFLYYTGVWALVSTLMVYLVNRFDLDQVFLGYLLGAYGLATMVSEGLLVRLLVPRWGERPVMRLGLGFFALQCAVVALAYEPWHLWLSIVCSLGSNLVYPSLSSLVSASVPAVKQGEAQGAINGVRALTEGFGPLFFGLLMQTFEDTPVPGLPYLLGSTFGVLALAVSYRIPDEGAYALWLDRSDDSGGPEGDWLLGPPRTDDEGDENGEGELRIGKSRALGPSPQGPASPPASLPSFMPSVGHQVLYTLDNGSVREGRLVKRVGLRLRVANEEGKETWTEAKFVTFHGSAAEVAQEKERQAAASDGAGLGKSREPTLEVPGNAT